MDATSVQWQALERRCRRAEDALRKRAEGDARKALLWHVLLDLRHVSHAPEIQADPRRLCEHICTRLAGSRLHQVVWVASLPGVLPETPTSAPTTSPSATQPDFMIRGPSASALAEEMQTLLAKGTYPPCIARALEADTTVVIEDPTTQCPTCPLSPPSRDGALLCHRIASGTSIYGVLGCAPPPERVQDPEEQAFLGLLASDLAIILHREEMAERLRASEEAARALINAKTDAARSEEALRAANARLEALWSITSLSDADFKAISDHVLETITKMTGSAYGFYGFLDEAESVMTIHSWSGQAMAHCSMVDKPMEFSIADSGLWAESVRRRRPLICNDYARPHRAKHGLPDGHVPLTKLLVVPCVARNRIVSVAAVANRDKDYDSSDIRQLLSFLQSIQAVLDTKRAQSLLTASERKFRSLVETTTDWVWQIDTKARFTYASPNCTSIIGFTSEELMGKTLFDLMMPDDARRSRSLVSTCIRNQQRLLVLEATLIHMDGHSLVCETNATPIFDTDERLLGYFGTCRDITAQKHAAEEQRRLREQLSHAQKMESIGRLAGGVAHDFNNMLSVILGHLDLALAGHYDQETLCSGLREARTAAQRSADLTRQLLGFARRQPITPKVLDLNETVASMLRMLRRLIGEDIDLQWLPGDDLEPVRIDPSQIDQILANLCVNARDAIGQATAGRITIETASSKLSEDDLTGDAGADRGAHVRLSVTDNGCGMDAQTCANIFEPFYTTKSIGRGTGLGLATVYGIVKQNNGIIRVNSQPGIGTTLEIHLPACPAAPSPAPITGSETSRHASQETILLVEDEKAILAMTTLLLEKEGYAVLGADTPHDALRLAREHSGNIDLLLTDLVMPGQNGRDLARELLAQRPGLKCIFMSGYTADIIPDHGILEEGVSFIQKPFPPEVLFRTIRNRLESG